MTSGLLFSTDQKSAVRSSGSTQSTGTPFCNSLPTRLTSPLRAASWKRSMGCPSISMEETIKSKQFDVCQTLYHSVQAGPSFQTLVQVKIKLFRVEMNLSAITNSQFFFLKMGLPKNIADGNSTVIIQLVNINNRNLTTKSNHLNMEK